jgi:hypothetical protein
VGFAQDTAITVDADLLKYAFEQQIQNLLRSGNTYAELHKGAVNALIAEHLRPRGFSTAGKLAAIANAEDFRPGLVYWVLSRIFAGQGGRTEGERQQALSKAGFYFGLYRESLGKVAIDPGDEPLVTRRGLPVLANVDQGSMFPALGEARPASVGGD